MNRAPSLFTMATIREQERPVDDLVKAYDEYIKLLEDECGKLYSFAWTHGFICPDEMVKRGEMCRAKIAELKSIRKND